MNDFEVAISLDDTRSLGIIFSIILNLLKKKLFEFWILIEFTLIGYLGKADCLRMMNEHNDAIYFYTEALNKEDSVKKVAFLKRAITYIDVK